MSVSLYRIPDFVLFLKNENSINILDFNQGCFLELNRVGYQMLQQLLKYRPEQVVENFLNIYDVEPKQLEQDLHELIQELIDNQLIVPVERNTTEKIAWRDRLRPIWLKILTMAAGGIKTIINPGKSPNALTVNLLLWLSWLSFRYLNWGATLDLWQHWHPEPIEPDPSRVATELETIDQLIRRQAAGSFFFPMVCKERALVGYHLLRVYSRLPVQLVIGTALYPLQVHAWVEYEGKILTDDPEHCAYFDPIITYPDETPLSPQPEL